MHDGDEVNLVLLAREEGMTLRETAELARVTPSAPPARRSPTFRREAALAGSDAPAGWTATPPTKGGAYVRSRGWSGAAVEKLEPEVRPYARWYNSGRLKKFKDGYYDRRGEGGAGPHGLSHLSKKVSASPIVHFLKHTLFSQHILHNETSTLRGQPWEDSIAHSTRLNTQNARLSKMTQKNTYITMIYLMLLPVFLFSSFILTVYLIRIRQLCHIVKLLPRNAYFFGRCPFF